MEDGRRRVTHTPGRRTRVRIRRSENGGGDGPRIHASHTCRGDREATPALALRHQPRF